MSDHLQRLRRRWEWEREAAAALIKANEHLRRELHQSERERRSLEDDNAALDDVIVNLRVERDAADTLLGEAMDQLLGREDS